MRHTPTRPPTESASFRVDAYGPTGDLLRPGARVPMGALLVATLAPEHIPDAADGLIALRRRVPWAPLGLVIPGLVGPNFKRAAKLARLTAARFLHFQPRPFSELRAALLDLDGMAADLLGTLQLHRSDLTPHGPTLHYVRRLVAAGAAGASFADAVIELDLGPRALEKRFARRGLRPPHLYHLFGGFAVTFAALAGDPELTGERGALEFSPYSDYASFAGGVRTRLRVSVTTARKRLPWEWIAFELGLVQSP